MYLLQYFTNISYLLIHCYFAKINITYCHQIKTFTYILLIFAKNLKQTDS